MGIFGTLLNRNENKLNINWIPLTSLDQINAIKEFSKTETIFIFKHSTRCGISNMVIKRFEKMFDESMNTIKVYYLDLLNYRSVSDAVSDTFQVVHQSPQLLVIKNEHAVFNTSHYDILQISISKFVSQ